MDTYILDICKHFEFPPKLVALLNEVSRYGDISISRIPGSSYKLNLHIFFKKVRITYHYTLNIKGDRIPQETFDEVIETLSSTFKKVLDDITVVSIEPKFTPFTIEAIKDCFPDIEILKKSTNPKEVAILQDIAKEISSRGNFKISIPRLVDVLFTLDVIISNDDEK